jgi:hypothetical protein
MLVLYLLPFLVVGVLWGKLLLRRRDLSRRSAPEEPQRRRPEAHQG